jgi:glycosyltransferase involved in cell wall biosynthesis
MPAYNASAYIREAIDSVLQQTFANIELIIVDDGSTDETFAIARQYASANCKVYQQANAGACRARNLAFEKCTGDYIQYLDADDILSKDKIEKQVSLFEQFGDEIITSSTWDKFYRNTSEAQFPTLHIYKNYDDPLMLLAEMWTNREMMANSVWLTPRKVIEVAGEWDETLTINQDGEFFCRVLLGASKIKFSNGKIFYRSGLSNSVSRSNNGLLKVGSLYRSFELYERHVQLQANDQRVKEGLAMNYYYFIYTYFHLYPDLVAKAVDRVKELAIAPSTSKFGGKNFQSASGLFGFYTILRIRKILHSVKKLF